MPSFENLSKILLLTTSCAIISTNCKPTNNTSIISKYAKVANFGSPSLSSLTTTSTTPKSLSEGRSHSGQALWAHRSDVNIVGGQNIKSQKPAVVYHYAVHKKPSEKISQAESVPAVGEVQERFNPRPYFDYMHLPSKYPPPKQATPAKNPSPTFDSFPVFSKPDAPSYDSGISSYNPPKAGTVAPSDDSGVAYPPNAPPPSDSDSPPEGYSYNAPTPDSPPPSEKSPEPSDEAKPSDDHPPKQEDQLFYPPGENGAHPEVILDHPPPGWKEPEDSKDQDKPMPMPMPMDHDMAEDDLNPPPSPDFQGRFPQYLYSDPSHQNDHAPPPPPHHDEDFSPYDFHDDHHHVYKEVTTTTTEAPEDERVNKGHYSYYYLGRKLWYIPLYFSVYFVVYVTVLILKSIARHKIQFKHEHFHRGARMMNDDEAGNNDAINQIHENVANAIEKNQRRRIPYIAM